MSWFKKSSDKEVEVSCQNCGEHQMVLESISAVFCKKCKKTIFTRKAMIKGDASPASTIEEETIPVEEETEIKKQQQAAEPKKNVVKPTPSTPDVASTQSQFMPSSHATGMKKITCSNCKTNQEVPSIALASFCEKCGQRVNLQDYKIKGNFHGELETRGEIQIASGAEVKANLNVGRAVVNGKIKGNIDAENRVELNDGCLVIGTIKSPVLIIHEGAGFVGRAEIRPEITQK